MSRDEGWIFEKKVWYKFMIQLKSDEPAVISIKQKGGEASFLFAGEDLEYNDIISGSFGFETFKTEVFIDDIRTAPEEDHALEAKWARGGAEEEEEEEEEGELTEVEILEESLGEGSGLDQCLLDSTIEHRNQWCENKFELKDAQDFCVKSFCNTCCESVMGVGASEIKVNECSKKCDKNDVVTTQEMSWAYCQDSYVPGRSLGHFCENNYLDSNPAMNCKIGLCNLCCVMSPVITGIPIKRKKMGKCFTACYAAFWVTKDVVISVSSDIQSAVSDNQDKPSDNGQLKK